MSIDPAFKRAQFERLKELNGQGRLAPEPRVKFTKRQREAVFEAFGGRCAKCQERVPSNAPIDHRVQLWRGGKHQFSNWELLCQACHIEKTSAEATENGHIRRMERRDKGERQSTHGIRQWRRFDGTPVRKPRPELP